MLRRSLAVWIACALALTGCASAPRPFTGTTILWRDDDQRRFGPRPEPRFAPETWDAADAMFFRPLARVVAFDTHGESVNVNALDEVPDSSWFTNRIGRREVSPEEIAHGACPGGYVEPVPPFRVVSGKSGGATAGFVLEDARRRRFLLKADRPHQPEQATAVDAIGAALYHAAGYHVPCNRVVFFAESDLVLDPGARIEVARGTERTMTAEDLERLLGVFVRAPSGLRGHASLMLAEAPLGPWDYRGTWERDLNDVVPHENRRDLRGMFVLNAWVDHWDARQHNTLATWHDVGDGTGWVRHHLIDFGAILGFVEGSTRQERRFGHTQWFDAQHVAEDFFTFGLIRRPWDDARRAPTWPTLGYYDVERFDPDAWRPNYWNGAFERRTERDMAWMARIVARFEEPHLRAAIALGRFSDPEVDRELLARMLGRRRRILERYLTRLSPLTAPRLGPRGLCLEDLAVASGIRGAGEREHAARVVDLEGRTVAPRGTPIVYGTDVCVALPDASIEYVVVRVGSRTRGRETTHPIEVHLAPVGGGWRIVGLDRLTGGEEPPR